jgi:hypothetical protein
MDTFENLSGKIIKAYWIYQSSRNKKGAAKGGNAAPE